MLSRYRPMQRLFAWLALVAMGLSAFAPMVSQLVIVPAIAQQVSGMDGMADMAANCHGHATPASAPVMPEHDVGHGGMPMDACGYCSFVAHHPGVPTVPVVLMRPPALRPDAAPVALPMRAPLAAWLFDAAPRGPPVVT